MGKRRMFSDNIVGSDAFLDMPLTAQALYFHLGMNADSDGFVNPKRVVRMVGGNEDDLRILIAKRFILIFPSGIAVIKHWWINNLYRADRHVPTTYQDEYRKLTKNGNNSYTEIAEITTELTPVDNQMATNRQPNGNPVAPQYNTSSIQVQDNTSSIQHNAGSRSAESRPERIDPKIIDGLLDEWEREVGFRPSNGTGNRRAVAALVREHGEADVRRLIAGVKQSHDDQYAPRISDFVSLKRKVNDLIVWGRKRGNKAGNVTVV